MGWAIGFAIVAIVCAVFLLLPLEVEINSERQVYRAGVKRFFYLQLLPAREEWRWGIRFLWWKRAFRLALPSGTKKGRKRAVKKYRKVSWRRGWRLLRSFTVRRLRVDLDTDDFLLNAYLYPVFTFLSRNDRRLAINFEGRAVVDVFLTNRVWKALWALIR